MTVVDGALALSSTHVVLAACAATPGDIPHPETERAILRSVRALELVLLERCGLDEERLQSLVDPDRGQLLSAVRIAAQRGKEANGLTFVYYIGHGLLASDTAFYLATAGKYAHDAPDGAAASFAEISWILEHDGPRSTAIFLDCCFADRARRSFGGVRPDAFSSDMPRGRYLLASTGETFSYVRDDGEGTAFTSELLKLLTLGDPTRPAMLTVGDCYEHLARELPKHRGQAPHQYSSDGAARIPLVANPNPAPVAPEGLEAPDSAIPCPYPGLSPFDASAARYFFGRDQVIADLIRRLRRRIADGGPLAVIGPSGVGKSSLLQAGLVPAVTREALGARRTWRCLTFSPGTQPLSVLASALARTLDGDPDEVRRRLLDDPGGLWGELARAHVGDGDGSVLLVVDQFEEIFTQAADRTERLAFLQALLRASGEVGRCLVVLSIRADFFGQCTAYPELVGVLQDDPLLVVAMSEGELRRAIVGPADAAGLHVGPEVVDRLLADLRAGNLPTAGNAVQFIGEDAGYDDAGTLPLLAHALQEAFLRREGRRLTLRSYERTGGIWRAVARTADEVYDSLAGLASGQAVARLILLSMVHLGRGADDARRTVDMQELFHGGNYAAELVREVAERLAKARLITLDAGTATLTHEAILRCWPRLRRWIEEDRAGLLIHQQLWEATRAWLAEERNASLLYRGSRLDDALAWARDAHHAVRLKPALVEFLAASVEQRRVDERTRRRVRRFRRAFTAAVTVLAVGAASFAYYIYRERNIAISREAAANAQVLRGSDAPAAMALALAAYDVDANVDTRSSLLSTYATPVPAVVRVAGQVIDAVAVSPAQDLMAVGLMQTIGLPQETAGIPAVQLWSLADHRRPTMLPTRMIGPDKVVSDVDFSPSGRMLAASIFHGPVWLWSLPPDLPDEITGRQLDGPADGFKDVSISPDDRYVTAIHIDDGVPWIWDLAGSGSGHPISGPPGGPDVDFLTYGPGGQLVGVRPDGVWTWHDPADRAVRPQRLLAAVDADGATTTVAFSRSQRTMATGAKSGVVRQWDLTDPRRPKPQGEALVGQVNAVHHLAYSADGTRLASAGNEAAIWIWNTGTGRLVRRLPQPSVVDDLAFAPAQDYLVSFNSRGEALVWDLPGPLISGKIGNFVAAAFSPDGSILATATAEGEVTLWRVEDSHHFQSLSTFTHDRGVSALSFDEDGTTLAVAGSGWRIQLWDLSRTQAPRRIGSPIAGPQHIITSVAFAQGRDILIAGSLDGGAHLWSIADPARPIALPTIKPTGDKSYFQVKRIATDPSGQTLAIGALDGIHLWHIGDPRHPSIVSELLPSSAWPNGTPLSYSQLAFSPDGELIAAGGGTENSGATVMLWDVRQPNEPRLVAGLSGPDEVVNSVAFSRDSRTVAAGGYDRTVWLWDVTDIESPQTIGRLTHHTDTINAVAFGGNSLLASVSSDNTTMLWDTDVEHVRRQMCQIDGLGMAMDQQGWRRYLPHMVSEPLCQS
ncbi:hypothetical protein K1W54_14865 [Micromonospora sp. CPCC 205371]|nr:hypothetical protein [Micromonospora sp. CPCC 205371]